MFDKKRYLLLEFFGDGKKFSAQETKDLVYSAVLDFIGEKGLSRAGLSLKKFDEVKQLGVLKCSLESVEDVITALALKRFDAGEKNVLIRLKKISGSMKPLR